MKKLLNAGSVILLFVFLALLSHIIFASSSPWTQSDWSGGNGQASWNDSTKFSSSSFVTTSIANQATLSLEQFTNPGFESNLNGWNGGTDPTSVTGMKLWLKADAITGRSNGDSIGAWPDSSGLGHDASQSASNRQPTYETNVLNGKPVIRFNGTSQGMYIPTTPDLDATDGFSVFVVTTARLSGANQVIVYKGSEDSGGSYNYRIIHWPDGNKYGGLNSVNNGEIYYAFGPTVVNTPQILTSYWDGANLYAYVDGTQAGNHSANVTGKTFTNDLQIGYNDVANDEFLQGDIAEIIIYNSIITNTQRQQVEAYLQAKYSISSGYGTITRDTTITHNSSAGSAKVVVGASATDYVQSVNVGNTDTYNLVAYAYTDGSAVTSTNAQLVYDGSTISTTYTSDGNGWYKLSGTVTGVNASKNYGVRVMANQTVYLDDMSLRDSGTVNGTLTSSIFDSGFTGGANWGTLTYSATTPTNTTATVKVRTGNQSDLSDATAFTSCSAISSGSIVSNNSCVTNGNRYAQYQIALSTTNSAATPTFSSFSLAFSDASIQPTPTSAPASSSTTSTPTSSSPTCSSQNPSSAPNLFQVSTSPTTATLYFNPVSPATGYIISYGSDSQANQYSTSFDSTNGSGAMYYTINSLSEGTTYYFKVQAKNGCATGSWSSVASQSTTQNETSQSTLPNIQSFLPNANTHGTIVVTNKTQTVSPKPTPTTSQHENNGYNLEILVQKNGKPVAGATVELHSVPQKTITDKNGIARFTNVEGGNHVVYMAYNGFSGQEDVTLNSKNKQVEINLSIQLNPYTNWLFIGGTICLVGFAVIIVFLLALLKKRRKSDNLRQEKV